MTRSEAKRIINCPDYKNFSYGVILYYSPISESIEVKEVASSSIVTIQEWMENTRRALTSHNNAVVKNLRVVEYQVKDIAGYINGQLQFSEGLILLDAD